MTDPTPTSTPHRATPEQWAEIMQVALGSPLIDSLDIATANALLQHNDSIKSEASFLTELAARVEALEAQQPAPCPHIVSSDEGTSYCSLAEQQAQQQAAAPAPAEDSDLELMWQVAEAISENYGPADLYLPDACSALHVVARWLRANGISRIAADRLEQEAGR